MSESLELMKKFEKLISKKLPNTNEWKDFKLGFKLESRGKYKEALRTYRKALANPKITFKKENIYHSRIAEILTKQRKYKEALRTYRKALANPKISFGWKETYHSRIAEILTKQRKYKEALDNLFVCLKLLRFYRGSRYFSIREMSHSVLLSKIGELYLKRKEYKKAEEYFKKFMKEYRPVKNFPRVKKLYQQKIYNKVFDYLHRKRVYKKEKRLYATVYSSIRSARNTVL